MSTTYTLKSADLPTGFYLSTFPIRSIKTRMRVMTDEPIHTPTPVEPPHVYPAYGVPEKEVNPKPKIYSASFLKIFGIFFAAVIILGSAGSYFKSRFSDVPGSYDECVQRSGSRLQKSIPAICITLEGNYFIQPVTDAQGNQIVKPPYLSPNPTAPIPTTDLNANPTPPGVCRRVGCSGELCVSLDTTDVISDCNFKPEYSCYQEAPCEVQPDGICGFTPSAGLSACLEKVKGSR